VKTGLKVFGLSAVNRLFFKSQKIKKNEPDHWNKAVLEKVE